MGRGASMFIFVRRMLRLRRWRSMGIRLIGNGGMRGLLRRRGGMRYM